VCKQRRGTALPAAEEMDEIISIIWRVVGEEKENGGK
jgi:hypothetical protein